MLVLFFFRRKLLAKMILEDKDLNYIYTNKLVEFLLKRAPYFIEVLLLVSPILKTNINVYWYRLNKPSVTGL
jgi:hypothetical protein